jgi:hypothetical protein
LGDEYHYIFECTEFINERKLYFDFVHINRHNIIKYNNLMSSKSIYTLSKLCTPPLFVYIKIFVKKQQKMSDHVRIDPRIIIKR